MALLDEARAEATALDGHLREFFATVSATVRDSPVLVSPEVEAAIERDVRDLGAEVAEFWGRFDQLLEQPGDAGPLRATAQRWSDIGNALGDTAADVSIDRMRANVDWAGAAAESYKATVPAQAENLSALKTLCLAMHDSLDGLADKIDNFWLAVKTGIIVFAVATVAALALCATVVGIPAAIGVVLGEAVAGTSLLVLCILQIQSLTQQVNTEQGTMLQKLRDVGESWPSPHAERLSGTGAGWRPAS